jgi:hypothetical protein
MSFGHFVLQMTHADDEQLKRRTADRAEATPLHFVRYTYSPICCPS